MPPGLSQNMLQRVATVNYRGISGLRNAVSGFTLDGSAQYSGHGPPNGAFTVAVRHDHPYIGALGVGHGVEVHLAGDRDLPSPPEWEYGITVALGGSITASYITFASSLTVDSGGAATLTDCALEFTGESAFVGEGAVDGVSDACPHITSVTRATTTYGNGGLSAITTCESGFGHDGEGATPVNRECQTDGSWSGASPGPCQPCRSSCPSGSTCAGSQCPVAEGQCGCSAISIEINTGS